MGRQSQPRGAQVYALYLSDQKGWSQDPPLPGPHLRVGNGSKGILLEISAYLSPSKGKGVFSFVSLPVALLYLNKSSLAAVWDLATLPSLLRFPLHYNA